MSLTSSVRGAQSIIGRNVLLSQQSSQQLPAMTYMRNTFALVQQRQRQQQQIVRMATTSAKVSTTHMSPEEALKMLNEQRSIRPNSPHMTIYEPQLTWIGSIANRITGVGLSALLYVWATGYLALPYTPIGEVLSSASLIHYAAMAPFWLKVAIKAPLAAAASYHTWNGFRHLAWDMGYLMSMKGIYASGYTVIGLTGLTTIGLCML